MANRKFAIPMVFTAARTAAAQTQGARTSDHTTQRVSDVAGRHLFVVERKWATTAS